MDMKRVVLTLAAALSLASMSAAHAQGYPTKPIRLLTHAAPGAANDALMRAVAAKLSELLAQQVVLENRPGAGNTIAPAIAAKATPDGYTLLHCAISDAMAPALVQRLPFDLLRDFSPVSLVSTTPNILMVHPSIPAKSVQEFVAYAKANPGKMDYASTGVGTSVHLSMELFKSITGINLVHVPYKGGPLLIADLVFGRVSTMMSVLPAQVDNIKTGKLRGLAVTSLRRSARLPEVPTVAESGVPRFEVTQWHGLCAPAAVPKPILARINTEVANAVSSPDLRSRLVQMGFDPQPSTSEQFAAFIRSETAKWAKVVKDAGIPSQ
ncbi:MAG: Bug family tripartite tricarboxylate transporter substrate binding protein [Burkholderiales bacterium]